MSVVLEGDRRGRKNRHERLTRILNLICRGGRASEANRIGDIKGITETEVFGVLALFNPVLGRDGQAGDESAEADGSEDGGGAHVEG